MSRPRLVHRCSECGAAHPRWAGRCGTCGEWNCLVEEWESASGPAIMPGAANVLAGAGGVLRGPDPCTWARPSLLSEVDLEGSSPLSTGLAELDRVLAGGLVPGSVTLLGGEPGIGKSTLLLQALANIALGGGRTLLVSAEESPSQVRVRAERLGTLGDGLWLVSETSLPGVLAAIDEVRPDVVVLDSIQTVADPEIGSAPGSVTQVKECASRLVRVAKAPPGPDPQAYGHGPAIQGPAIQGPAIHGPANYGPANCGPAIVLVGHVTKEGNLAGPRVLEHVVDTVLSFEGERHHALRLMRATKHRFGPTGELGLFEMTGTGLVGVPDPSGMLLGDRRPGVPGAVVMPAMEGQRPLLVEVQALVSKTQAPMPRRSAQGLDGGRLALLLAVLERHARLRLGGFDVFASAVGGVRVVEPAADLAVALALASASSGVPIPSDLVACGEIGLGGEVRQVVQVGRRLGEAHRLGFRRAVVPASSPDGPPGIELVRVASLAAALVALGLVDLSGQGRRPPPPFADPAVADGELPATGSPIG
ncbi:MAG: DNA repair protein RadA [Acidimicrobiales bacterium]